MPNVVFIAPFFQETTLRLLGGVLDLPETRVGLVSQDPESKLPAEVRSGLSAHYRVEQGLDSGQIEHAIRAIGGHLGSVDRILGALEELQVPLGDLREKLGIPGLSGEAARNFRDKARMKSLLQNAGLPCARHHLARSVEEARIFAAEMRFPLVGKPPAGSGARGTFRLDAATQLEEYLATAPPTADQPLLLEEFVTGTEHSFDSVCLNGKLIWHSISHYAPSPLEVLRTPWIQWCVLIPRETDDPDDVPIYEAARQALPALGLVTGLSHMEWFRRPDGRVAISEVGARPPGAQFTKLISYAHDFDLYAAWARLMVFDEFTPRERPYAAGAAYLRGQGQGRVTAVTGLEEVFRDLGEIVQEYRIPRAGQPPSGSYEGEGYVIVRHPDTAVVEQALRQVIERARVVLG